MVGGRRSHAPEGSDPALPLPERKKNRCWRRWDAFLAAAKAVPEAAGESFGAGLVRCHLGANNRSTGVCYLRVTLAIFRPAVTSK
jgi:hypothetical protein